MSTKTPKLIATLALLVGTLTLLPGWSVAYESEEAVPAASLAGTGYLVVDLILLRYALPDCIGFLPNGVFTSSFCGGTPGTYSEQAGQEGIGFRATCLQGAPPTGIAVDYSGVVTPQNTVFAFGDLD